MSIIEFFALSDKKEAAVNLPLVQATFTGVQ